MIGKPDLLGYCHPISAQKAKELQSVGIDGCGLSIRTTNILKRLGAHNLLDVAVLTEEEIIYQRGCGRKSLLEVIDYFNKIGIEKIPVCVFETAQEEEEAEIVQYVDDKNQKIADALEYLKTINVIDANLSVRSANCLTNRGLKTLYDFAVLNLEDAYKIQGLGKGSIDELTAVLKSYGIDYPLEDIDLTNLHPSFKYIGIDYETIDLLSNSGIDGLDDLLKLSEDDLYKVLDICPGFDTMKLLIALSAIKPITIREEYISSYLVFTIREILDGLKMADNKLLRLKYGLCGEKKWPSEVIASSLAIDETQLIHLIDKILLIFTTEMNYKKIEPIINYCNNIEATDDGYILLIKEVIKLKSLKGSNA